MWKMQTIFGKGCFLDGAGGAACKISATVAYEFQVAVSSLWKSIRNCSGLRLKSREDGEREYKRVETVAEAPDKALSGISPERRRCPTVAMSKMRAPLDIPMIVARRWRAQAFGANNPQC
ncbi:hypothetical protein Trydic_g16139 [Trypoxylus dichotomus]